MITKLSLSLWAVGLALLSSALTAAPAAALPKLTPVAGQQYVEIDLDRPLLRLAGQFAGIKDQSLRELIDGLQHVRVTVVGVEAGARAMITDEFARWHGQLEAAGWRRWVEVREANGTEVLVCAKLDANGAFEGLAVSVLDGAQAVVVNIAGRIETSQLASVGQALGIAPLARLATLPSL
jgi:hypothetical protein